MFRRYDLRQELFIQASPTATAATVLYQFVVPFVGPVFGAITAFVIYWIKDHDPSTREFERQTKRLQFWKAFHDLQTVAPLKPNINHQIRCKQTLESAALWVEAVPTKAFQYSKWFSLLGLSIATSLLYGVMLGWLPPPQPGEENGRAFLAILIFGCLALAIYQILYESLRAEITRGLLWLSKHVRFFAFLGEMAGT